MWPDNEGTGSFALFSDEMPLSVSASRALCRKEQRRACGARQGVFTFAFHRSLWVLVDVSSFSSVRLCAYFLFPKFELYFRNGFKCEVVIWRLSMNHLTTSGHMLCTKFLWDHLPKMEFKLIAISFEWETIIFLLQPINCGLLDIKWLPRKIKAQTTSCFLSSRKNKRYLTYFPPQ